MRQPENGGLASGEVDRHAFQSNSLRRNRDALARATIRDRHSPRHAAADLEADLVACGLSGRASFGVKGTFFPRTGDAASALAQLAPDINVGALALATDGHAELRPAAGIVGVAFKTFGFAVAQHDLPASSPRAEQNVEWIAGGSLSVGPCSEHERRRQGQGSQEARGGGAGDYESHRPLFPAVCLQEQAKIAITQ